MTHPTPDRLQKKAVELRQAEDKLTDAWSKVRGFATRASPLIPGIPLGVMAAVALGGPNGHEVGAPAFLAAMAASPLLTYLVTRGLEALTKRKFRGDPRYRQLLEACAALGRVPEPLAGPVDRALEAFFAMRGLASEPDWQRAGIPAKALVADATTRLIELLEWARRLQKVASHLDRAPESASRERAETAAHFERQVRQLGAAADVFVQTEAKMTRAFCALSADRSTGSAAQAQFHEMTATLDALAEVLTSPSEEGPPVPRSVEPPAEIQQVELGRRS